MIWNVCYYFINLKRRRKCLEQQTPILEIGANSEIGQSIHCPVTLHTIPENLYMEIMDSGVDIVFIIVSELGVTMRTQFVKTVEKGLRAISGGSEINIQ